MLDVYHIVTLASDAPGEARRRVQQDTTIHRGRKSDPLYLVCKLLRASHTKAHPTPTRTTLRGLRGRKGSYQCRSRIPLRPASARCLPPRHTPPKADAWPQSSLSTYEPALSPRSPAQAETYENRMMPLGSQRTGGSSNTPNRSHQRTLSNWVDTPPEATETPPSTNPECSSSPQA